MHSTVWDHPRSRGVYSHSELCGDRREGSSPLARGLRRFRLPGRMLRRIIPARAGFTVHGRFLSGGVPDHPRSRGVYQRGRDGPVAVLGIIPARAGFTLILSCAGIGGKDHPRSRGVYETLPIATLTVLGSSPLARGLRESSSLAWGPIGIIPARAGFTSHSELGGDRREGSSPLARGLRRLGIDTH